MEDKPWKNEELRSAEEALPRVKESTWKKCRDFIKQKTRVVCDCFHPEVSVDLTQETTGEIVEFLEKVEQSGKWQQQACTTMFFLIPKNVTTERLIALMPTLIRWWGALRALEVAKQQKYRVGWDATDGRNGGPSKRCGKFWWRWKDSMTKQKKKIKGASALVVDLAKAFERVQSSCDLRLGDALRLLKEDLANAVRVLRAPEACTVRRMCGRPLTTITVILPALKWSCLLFRIVLQDASSEATRIYPRLKLRVFVDDVTALLRWKTKVVAEMAKKMMKKLKDEVERKGLDLSVTEDGKERAR